MLLYWSSAWICALKAKFHYAVQLASRLLACRRPAREAARELVRELNSVVEFGFKGLRQVVNSVQFIQFNIWC